MADARDAFPPTRVSLLEAVRSGDATTREAALESLSRAYWQPARAYVRLRWRVDDDVAQDLVQEFFAQALSRDLFARYEPARARFRTFLRLCLDSFVANERKAAARLKRGGRAVLVPLDDVGAAGSAALRSDAEADAMLEREWARAVFGEAVDRLRHRCEARGKRVPFAIFARYDLEGPTLPVPPSYAALAQEFDVPVTQVTNYLAWCRREFRALVLDVLRERAASDEEYRADALELLGVRVS